MRLPHKGPWAGKLNYYVHGSLAGCARRTPAVRKTPLSTLWAARLPWCRLE
jgi:hypothetical protein